MVKTKRIYCKDCGRRYCTVQSTDVVAHRIVHSDHFECCNCGSTNFELRDEDTERWIEKKYSDSIKQIRADVAGEEL